MTMFGNLDFDVIRRSLPYLFLDGMSFTLMLTGADYDPDYEKNRRQTAATDHPGRSRQAA